MRDHVSLSSWSIGFSLSFFKSFSSVRTYVFRSFGTTFSLSLEDRLVSGCVGWSGFGCSLVLQFGRKGFVG